MRKTTIFLFYFFISLIGEAQKPREVILENDPVDWSDTAKQIVLIVIPLCLLLLGIIFIRKKKKSDQN